MEKPTLYILCGLPFSGKTTLAKEMARRLGLIRIDLDEVKFEYGFEGVSDDDVSHENWIKIFNDMYSRIEKELRKGNSVISDISNLERAGRDKLRAVAIKEGLPTKVIFLDVPESLARKRWLQNRNLKKRFDITGKIFNEAIDALEKPTEDENVIVFNQSLSVENWINKYFGKALDSL